MRTQLVLSLAPPACCECEVHSECALQWCTHAEHQRALAIQRRVRDEQRRLLAEVSPQR